MPLRSQILKAITTAPGSVFTIVKTITSSAITTAAQDLTSAATGRLLIRQIIVKTDATGLAGGTNFVISSNNAKGLVNIAVETVANLGANVQRSMVGNPPAADTTTSDSNFSVTSSVTVIEAGKKMQFNNTGAAGTGAGTIDVFITFERIDANATIVAA